MSNIKTIYTNIANMTVGSIPARNVISVDQSILSGDLPVRILLPKTSADMEFVMLGNLEKLVWSITDLCIFGSVSAGSGVEQYSEDMVDYMNLYMTAIKSKRNPAPNCHIEGVQIELGPILWGDKDYWAVEIILTVSEVL